MSKKKYFNLLPEIFRTDVNKAFYDATYEQLFSEKGSSAVEGYIGRRVNGQWDPETDNYLAETTKNRTWYQLEPIVASKNVDTDLDENEIAYEDYINLIKYNGGLTDNHDRLFSGKYYTFSPPIDVDKFVNYHSYKWVVDMPVITLINVSDIEIKNDIIGTTEYVHVGGFVYKGKEYDEQLVFTSGLKINFLDSSMFNGDFYVEGVGNAIKLVKETLADDEFDEIVNVNYTTIARGSLDGNTWSRRNRWVHIEVLEYIQKLTGESISYTNSRRQIIEFITDIELYDFGAKYITDVDYVFDNNNASFNDIHQTAVTSLILDDRYKKLENCKTGEKILFTFNEVIEFSNTYQFVVQEEQPYVYTMPMPISDMDDIVVNVTRGMTQYNDVDWYTVEEQFNRLSFTAYSPNIDWLNPIDDIQGLMVGDVVTIIVGDQNIILNTVDYVWSISVENDVVILYPYGTKTNVLPKDSVVFAHDSQQVNYVKDTPTSWTMNVQQYINQYSTPKFELYYTHTDVDGNAIPLGDLSDDFNGSEIFSYKTNELNPHVDPYIGLQLEYKNLGQVSDVVFEHDIMSKRYNTVVNGELREILGYYYYNVSGVYETTWRLHASVSKQYVIDQIVIKTFKESVVHEQYFAGEYSYKLDTTDFVSSHSVQIKVVPIIGGENAAYYVSSFNVEYANGINTVTINQPLVDGDYVITTYSYGDNIKTSIVPAQLDNITYDVICFKGGKKLVQNSQYFIHIVEGKCVIYLNVDVSYNDVITVKSYSKTALNDGERGYYEVPIQLEANPLNGEVIEYSANDLMKHFSSIIEFQSDFIGDMYSNNNYRDTKKDLSVGTEILQTIDTALKGMLIISHDRYNIIQSLELSKNEYIRYKDKIIAIAKQIQRELDYREPDNVVAVDSVIKDIVKRMNNSTFYNGAFSTVNMFCHSEFYFEQTYSSAQVSNEGITVDIIEDIDLFDPFNAIYVYRGKLDEDSSEFVIDKKACDVAGIDYEIIGTNPIQIKINNHKVGQEILVRVYKNSNPAYMPTTPSKNGLYKTYVPELMLDTTYANEMYVIKGHDGSITPILNSDKVVYANYADVTVIGDEYTIAAHGFKTGQMIIFSGDTFSGGHNNDVIYYVIRTSNDTFKIAGTEYNAYHGIHLVLDDSTLSAGPINVFPISLADIALFEIERRIYNGIRPELIQSLPKLQREDVFASEFREGEYSDTEYKTMLKRLFLRWKNENNSNYKDNSTVTQNWKTWNYASVNPTIPGNWRGMYFNLYDTIRPDTHPWEMLGFSIKPTWWDVTYSPWTISSLTINNGGTGYAIGDKFTITSIDNINTAIIRVTSVLGSTITGVSIDDGGLYNSEQQPTLSFNQTTNVEGDGTGAVVTVTWSHLYYVNDSTDYGDSNTLMWGDLELGLIRHGERAGIDARYARQGLSSIIPVDSLGGLLSPHDVGIAIEPTDNKEQDWVFGDVGPVENMWKSSSEYIYDLMKVLYLAKPARFGSILFDTITPITASIDEGQIIDANTLTRPTFTNYLVTGEIGSSGLPTLKYGYQNFICDYVLFNVGDVSTFGNTIRSLYTKLGYKVGGFIDNNTMDTFMQSVNTDSKNTALIIPKENINVKLYKAPIVNEFVYSGLIIKKTIDGKFYVSGYDSMSNHFTYYVKPSNVKQEKVVIGGKTPNYTYFKIGRQYVKGQIVKYRSAFHECAVDHVPDEFVEQYWIRLPNLPTYGGTTVYVAKSFIGPESTLEYGEIIDDQQKVVDFIVGYGLWLKDQGWIFDDVNAETNELEDWIKGAKDFVYWNTMNWGTDNVLFLNPSAKKLKLKINIGYPDQITTVNKLGYTGVADQYGFPINMNDVYVYRDDQVISVEPMDSKVGINLLRVPTTQYEHLMAFDNKTIFNDIVFDPILKDRQARLKLSGIKSENWFGKLVASGYLVNGDQLLMNPENRIESLRYLYDEDVKLDNTQLEDAAKHLIGYDRKQYMDDLRISGDTQYKFYRGMITEKGTKSSISKLLRSEFIEGNDTINVYEEWAVKLADFGAIDNNKSLEFKFDPSEVKTDPQHVVLDYVSSSNNNMYVKQIKIINAPAAYTFQPLLEIRSPKNGGTKAVAEIVLDKNGLMDSINIKVAGTGYDVAPEYTVMVYDNNRRKYVKSTNGEVLYFVMGKEISHDDKFDQTIIIDIDDHDRWVRRPHGTRSEFLIPTTNIDPITIVPSAGYVHKDDVDFMAYDINALFSLYESNRVPVSGNYIWVADATVSKMSKSWTVYKVATKTDLDISKKSVPINPFNEIGDYFVYQNTVYSYILDEHGCIDQLYIYGDDQQVDVLSGLLESLTGPDGTGSTIIAVDYFYSVRYDDYAAVDATESRYWVDNFNDGWAFFNGSTTPHRIQETTIDSSKFKNAVIYNLDDEEVARLEYYDPYKNVIPGIAESNITFKSDVDPARYSVSNNSLYVDASQTFGEDEVGLLWWDVSTCRYMLYEQGDSTYKRDNWGKLFDGSKVNIYEWTKSYDTPLNYSGNGTPRNQFDYVSSTQYSPVLGKDVNVYYFWVSNKTIRPSNIMHRTISSAEVASIISNPSANGVKWFSFIKHDSTKSEFVFNGIEELTYGSPFIMQINYNMTDDEQIKHVEWKLLKDGDKNEVIPTSLWNKLVDSLSEIDSLGNIVPDPVLSPRENCGINIRPRQSMVTNVNEARRTLVYKINTVLNTLNIKDSGVDWEQYIPKSKYWSYIDWYENGYDKDNTVPMKQIKSYDETEIFTDVSNGDIIKQYAKDDSTWYEIIDVDSKEIKIVKREKAAIKILDISYLEKNNNTQRQFIRSLLTTLNAVVYVGEDKHYKNELFFAMINYIYTERNLVDWLFKSTYISISHEGQVLSRSNFYRPTTIDSFLSYVNEVKPYQTKLREYNLTYSSPLDSTKLSAWDFDSLKYTTETESNQNQGDASSIINGSPVFDPYSVPRIFKINQKYDAVQCGFENKRIHINIGEEEKITNGLLDYILFDTITTVSKVLCDGYELPADFYQAEILLNGKLKLTFLAGIPAYGHKIKVISGISFTHTMLEEARLFNSVGFKDQHYHISSRYKQFTAELIRSNNLYGGNSTITLTNAQWKRSLAFGSMVTIFGSSNNDGKYSIKEVDGYTLVLLNDGNGRINQLKILSGGANYQVDDMLTVVNGSGQNAKLKVLSVNSNGRILSVRIESQGTDYSSSDTGLVTTTTGSGYGAIFEIVKIDGELINELILQPKPNSEIRFSVTGFGATAMYDLKTTVYGQTKTGFGNFKFGKIPFGRGGVAIEENVEKHIPFSIDIGATNRILHSNKDISQYIKKAAYTDAPLYSDYCEKNSAPTYKETDSLNQLQQISHDVLSCDFEGMFIDGEDYLYGMTVSWDSEPWDIAGEYPQAGWDRELTEIGSISPMATSGQEYMFDYDVSNMYTVDFIFTPDSIMEIVVIENYLGNETMTQYIGTVTASYDYATESDYKTTFTLVDLPEYANNPPDYVVKVKMILKPVFTFLSTGRQDFKIPYLLTNINVAQIVDLTTTPSLTVTEPLFTANQIGNDTYVTLTNPPVASDDSPLTKAYISIWYDHENSNVYDNGELFNTLDASYFTEEFFDEGMTEELARYNVTESVVINVDTNCVNGTATLVYSADDYIHWDSETEETIFENGSPITITHVSGFDNGFFDAEIPYRSKYLVPSVEPLANPALVTVHVLEDSINGILSDTVATVGVDYEIMSIPDYINNYCLVVQPTLIYQDILDSLKGEYSTDFIDAVSDVDFVNNYCVILFGDDMTIGNTDYHINPIEDNTISTAHGHTGKPSNKIKIELVSEQLSFTIHYQEDGDVTYTRNSDAYSTTLYEAVSPDDIEIKVVDATVLAVPSIYNVGVLWINNERITYTNIVNNGGYYTLQGVMRATNGTSLPTGLIKYGQNGVYPVGEKVFAGDSTQFIPNGSEWNWTNNQYGLAASTSQQAQFLRSNNGCKI